MVWDPLRWFNSRYGYGYNISMVDDNNMKSGLTKIKREW
jgi:hypothetical protein